VLRGAGDTRFTLWANLVGHWALGLPAALGLGLALGLGVTGLWWGLLIGLSAVALALFLRFRRLSSREIVPIHGAAGAGGAGALAAGPRLSSPQPWEEVPHTADVGSPPGAPPRRRPSPGSCSRSARSPRRRPGRRGPRRGAHGPRGEDLAGTAVEVMREVHFRLAARGRSPAPAR